MPNRVMILLSGGLKSAVTALDWKSQPDASIGGAIFFDYGQRMAQAEHEAAKAVAAYLEIPLGVIELPHIIGLTVKPLTLFDKSAANEAVDPYVPSLVPTMLLVGAAVALREKCNVLLFGGRLRDGGCPDLAPATFMSIGGLIQSVLMTGLKVEAPLHVANPEDVVKLAQKHKAERLFSLTHSCLSDRRPGCGVCRGCRTRVSYFRAAKTEDRPFSPGKAGEKGKVMIGDVEIGGDDEDDLAEAPKPAIDVEARLRAMKSEPKKK